MEKVGSAASESHRSPNGNWKGEVPGEAADTQPLLGSTCGFSLLGGNQPYLLFSLTAWAISLLQL